MSTLAQSGFGPHSTVARLGRLWFQWRSLSPIPLFILLLVLPADFSPKASVLAWAIFAVVAAEALRLWAVGYAGSATRTRGDSVPVLVTAGPYRHVRNPLYIANILMYSACGVIFGFTSLSVFILCYSAIQYIFIVAFEEEILEREFGSAYVDFCAKVSRWSPSIKPSCESSGHEFDLAKAFRSERSTFYSMGLMALLYVLKATVL